MDIGSQSSHLNQLRCLVAALSDKTFHNDQIGDIHGNVLGFGIEFVVQVATKSVCDVGMDGLHKL